MSERTVGVSLSPSQLGALTGNGLVEAESEDIRRKIRIRLDSRENEVWTKIATNDEGEEFDVVVFPEDIFDQVLAVTGMEEGQNMCKVGDMIWVRDGHL